MQENRQEPQRIASWNVQITKVSSTITCTNEVLQQYKNDTDAEDKEQAIYRHCSRCILRIIIEMLDV